MLQPMSFLTLYVDSVHTLSVLSRTHPFIPSPHLTVLSPALPNLLIWFHLTYLLLVACPAFLFWRCVPALFSAELQFTSVQGYSFLVFVLLTASHPRRPVCGLISSKNAATRDGFIGNDVSVFSKLLKYFKWRRLVRRLGVVCDYYSGS